MEKGFPPPPRLSRNPPHPFTLYPGTLSRRSDTRPETKPHPEQDATPARRRCRKHSRSHSRRSMINPGGIPSNASPEAYTRRHTRMHPHKPGKSPHKPGGIPGLYGYLIPCREAIQTPARDTKSLPEKPHFSGPCKNRMKPAWYKAFGHPKTPQKTRIEAGVFPGFFLLKANSPKRHTFLDIVLSLYFRRVTLLTSIKKLIMMSSTSIKTLMSPQHMSSHQSQSGKRLSRL